MPKKAKISRPSVFEIVGGYTNVGSANSHSEDAASAPAAPAAPAAGAASQGHQQAGFSPSVDMLSGIVGALNGNPYIIGAAYLIINLGGRFLTLELTKQQEAFLANKAIRPLLLFSVLFIATRNLAVAFWTTIIVLAIIWFFANENHFMCLIPGWRKDGVAVVPLPQGMFVLGQAAPTQEKFTATSDEKTYAEKMKIIQNAK